MDENEIRNALNRHWAASDANDFEIEHDIYREDAVLEYPQSGERIRGRDNIQASRVAQPNSKRFTVRRIVQGEGVERIFPVHSPMIGSIEIVRTGRVRRAKLNYLRARKGKAARIKGGAAVVAAAAPAEASSEAKS